MPFPNRHFTLLAGRGRFCKACIIGWGDRAPAYDVIRSAWKDTVLSRAKTPPSSFESFWEQAVHDGFVEVKSEAVKASDFQFNNVELSGENASTGDFVLGLYSKVGLTDSRHAHNPWLQELPDPVTKVTWDNYVCMSPAAAEKRGITDGDLVRLATATGAVIELPALIQRGQHDRMLSIALAYGVRGTERFAKIGPQWLESRPTVGPNELVGKNAASFIEFRDGNVQFTRSQVTLEKVRGRHELASTQRYDSLEIPRNVAPHGGEVRDIVQETTLSEFARDPHAGTPETHHHGGKQLWAEDHPKSNHHWGMVVDQNRCTGCSACLIACQSENNVPVVGKDEVRRQREMHWIRIDRYYSGNDDDMQTAHQPMMCQHCDNRAL